MITRANFEYIFFNFCPSVVSPIAPPHTNSPCYRINQYRHGYIARPRIRPSWTLCTPALLSLLVKQYVLPNFHSTMTPVQYKYKHSTYI